MHARVVASEPRTAWLTAPTAEAGLALPRELDQWRRAALDYAGPRASLPFLSP